MTSEKYWEERALALEREMMQNSLAYRGRILKAYQRAAKDIEQEIERIYRIMQTNSKMTRKELESLMNANETKEYYERLRKQFESIDDADERRKLLAEINAPAYKYRISRWRALQASVDTYCKKLGIEEIRAGEQAIKQAYEEAYYKSVFEVQKKAGLYFNFDKLPEKAAELALRTPWKDAVYSERVWGNLDKLRDNLDEMLPAALMSGRSTNKVAQELSSVMEKGIGVSMRLIRTELSRYHNEAEYISYQNMGIKKYRYYATLDKKTCEKCGKLDLKVLPMEEKKTGINFPPLHPNDRCTVAPVIDSKVVKEVLSPRKARDPKTGKKVECPAGTTWEEWKNTCIKDLFPKQKKTENTYIQNSLEGKIGDKSLIIPSGAAAEKVRIMAGKGTSENIRVASQLSKAYGGKEWQWEKKGGIITTDNYIYDVHWYELDGMQYEPKCKSIKEVKK